MARVDRDAHETLCIREKGRNKSRLHGTESRPSAGAVEAEGFPLHMTPFSFASSPCLVWPPCPAATWDWNWSLESVWSASSPRGGTSRRWQCDGGGWTRHAVDAVQAAHAAVPGAGSAGSAGTPVCDCCVRARACCREGGGSDDHELERAAGGGVGGASRSLPRWWWSPPPLGDTPSPFQSSPKMRPA